MDMVSFQKKFVHGLRWNSLESILYYTLLAAHQILLRTITDNTLYGAIGTLFALVYLAIVFSNGGLDLSIVPFFSIYRSSKHLFKNYLLKQLIAQGLIYSAVASLVLIILATGYLPIKNMPSISWSLALIIAILIVSEGIKKSLRIILQLAFLTHITAAVELFYIISYVTIVWTHYFLWRSISLYAVFIPMLMLSLCATALLCCATYWLYRSLPETIINKQFSWKHIGYNRVPNYGYQVTRALFTSNFLIPFFAIKFGLSVAALLELVTAFNQFITIIIKKIFGITGQALLSHVKHMSLPYKRAAFELASSRLYPILYAVIALVFIAYKPIFALKSAHFSEKSGFIGLLFFLLLFSENFILLYEKWFIIEEKTFYLILFNGSLLALFWGVIQMPYFNSPLLLLAILIVLRLTACFCLSIISFCKWKLKIPYRAKPRSLAYVLLFLLGCFLILR